MPKCAMSRAGKAMGRCLLCMLVTAVPTAVNAGDEAFRLLTIDGYSGKWGDTTLGTGAVVSYAFVRAPQHFSDTGNCRHLVPMDSLAKRSGISPAEIQREVAAAFRVWEEAGNISFVPAKDADQADILIGAQGKPAGRAFANIVHQEGSRNGVRAIDHARVCLNPEQPWKIGFDGNKDVYDIRYTLVHEIGHVIGLDHAGPSGQVMSFRYTERYRELQAGDLRGLQRLYGPGSRGGPTAAGETNQGSADIAISPR